jgi:hypothetical protein
MLVCRGYAPLVLASMLLVHCGPRSSTPPVAVAHAPPKAAGKEAAFDFDALLRREASALPMVKVTNETFSAEVEAAAPPELERTTASLQVSVPVGTASPIKCYVYDGQRDGAATMAAAVANVKTAMEVRLFEPTDVFVAARHAVLAAHAIYIVKQNEVKAAGELKMAFYNHPLTSAICMHDEPGYTATFKRITKHLFESMSRSDREYRMKPKSWSVSVTKLNGRPVGFDDSVTYETTNEVIVTSTRASELLPRSAVDAMPGDSIASVSTDRSGNLLERTDIRGHGKEIELKVDLKRIGQAHYGYQGELSGKPISGKFKTKDTAGIATGKSIATRIKTRLLSGKATSFKAEEYVPNIDPTAVVETSYEIESASERKVRSLLGALKLSAVVDAEGEIETAAANIGGANLTIERLGFGAW